MAGPSSIRKPVFIRQAILILLPTLILAGLGIYSLRQDRLLARHAASAAAQGIADRLLPQIWAELTNSSPTKIQFRIDAAGRLVWPVPAPSPEELRPGKTDAEGAKRYRDALEALRAGNEDLAIEQFTEVVRKHAHALGETGLPLRPLAEFKLLQIRGQRVMDMPVTLESFSSNLVNEPTPLTPLLLEKALFVVPPSELEQCRRWITQWEAAEQARQLYASLAARHTNLWDAPGVIGLDKQSSAGKVMGEERPAFYKTYVVRTGDDGTNALLAVRDSTELGAAMFKIVQREKGFPEYFGVAVDVGGAALPVMEVKMWAKRNWFGRAGGGVHKEVLEQNATEVVARASTEQHGIELATVKVLLSNPAVLYEQQRTRTFWFGAVIGVSAVVALLGLAGAWRSFRQQEQLSALKTNFVSSVSHELRSPIASVRLMAESLERGKISEEGKRQEYYRFISQECRRLSSLIENVLDFSRIEQGRKQYEFESCDLTAIIESTLKLMEPVAAERGVRLVFRERPATTVVRTADGKALQQALVNLVDNALKHSAAGSVVELGLAAANGAATLLWVEDHGPGIPENEHERIFERFYRLGSELRRETQGVGIGLSIVKHIVEAHGGQVRVRSAPGQGSRFTMELPATSEASSGKA